ncbi:MAG: hypothetical protein AB1345_04050 [Chloroflexota bacterium]
MRLSSFLAMQVKNPPAYRPTFSWIRRVLFILLIGISLSLPPHRIQTRVCGPFQGGLTPSQEAIGGSASGGESLQEEPASTISVPAPPELPALLTLSPRAGFGLAEKADPLLWARRLGAGWYLDWAARSQPDLLAPEHWQMVRITPTCLLPNVQAIRQLASRYPGLVWVIGNEPDVIWQDNLTPEVYAQHYHELYYLIKGLDPRASIATAGVSQATPLRLAYLDRVLAAYQRMYGSPMPVDWWTVHGFILREERNSWGVDIPPGFQENQGVLYEIADHARLDLFREHIIAFRQWMAENGYRQKPLALTEFGVLMPSEYGFPPELVADFLEQTFNWLDTARDPQTGYPTDEDHLVQRWAWFSLSDPLYLGSNLADLDQDILTQTGMRFREFVLGRLPSQPALLEP